MSAISKEVQRKEGDAVVQARQLQNWVTAAVVATICIYYFWILVPCRLLPQNHYHNLLAEAFAAGRTSLLLEPSKELLSLADPYDPVQNGPYRLHDASLYKGKYYLYFGPTPALVLFLPLDALLGIRIKQETATALFLCAGFIASTLLFKRLLEKIRPTPPWWMFALGSVALGLCNAGPGLLLRPDVYEVSIACAYTFGMTALYLLVSAIFTARPCWWQMVMGSFCAGLALGARPSYIVFGLFLPVSFLGLVLQHRSRWLSPPFVRGAICLFLPFALCVRLAFLQLFTLR